MSVARGSTAPRHDFIDYRGSWNKLLLEPSPAPVLRSVPGNQEEFLFLQVKCFLSELLFSRAGLKFGTSYGNDADVCAKFWSLISLVIFVR